MAYLKNSVLDFTDRTIENYIIEDYFTFDVKKVLDFIEECKEDFFEYYQISDDDKIERVALELYGNPNYWDILTIINGRDALFEMPYNFDTLSEMANSKADNYVTKISKFTSLPETHINYLKEKYEEDFRVTNENNRVVKIVKPARMQEFIRKAYENGCFV